VIDLCDSESEEKAPKVARKTAGKAHAGCAGDPIIALLLDMGFDASQARAAAEATGFSSVDAAVDWLSNQDEPQEPQSQAEIAADPHAAASMAAAAAAAAERAKVASDKLTALQHEKERARKEAARNAAQRASKAAAPPAKKPRIGTGPLRVGAGAGWHYAPGDVVYAGDVLNTRGGGGGFGWEGMGTTNLGGMDDFFSL
jgi:septum formation inhibitor MinC